MFIIFRSESHSQDETKEKKHWVRVTRGIEKLSIAIMVPSGRNRENAAFFLRLGLPSTLIHQENGAFQKGSSIGRNLIKAFRYHEDRKQL